MSYIVLFRNPNTRKLSTFTTGDDVGQAVMEFDSEVGAHSVAYHSAACRTWGYEVVQVDVQ